MKLSLVPAVYDLRQSVNNNCEPNYSEHVQPPHARPQAVRVLDLVDPHLSTRVVGMACKMVDRQTLESDCLDDLEENFARQQASSGYETGFEKGKKAGQEDGFARGSIEGKARGSEIGFYKGYTMTWLLLLQQESPKMQRSSKTLNKLNEILNLVEAFPNTNETDCEDKISKIRVKFKQFNSLMNVKQEPLKMFHQ